MNVPRDYSATGLWKSFFGKGHYIRWNSTQMVILLCFYTALALVATACILSPFHDSLNQGPTSDNKLINFLEIVYFVTNSFVAIFAVVAIVFAREQFRQSREQTRQLIEQNKHMENARVASTYMDLSKRWDEPPLTEMRATIRRVVDYHHGPPRKPRKGELVSPQTTSARAAVGEAKKVCRSSRLQCA